MAETKKEPVYFTKLLGIERELVVLLSHFKKQRSSPSLTRIFILSRGEWAWLTDIDEVAYGLALMPKKGARERVTFALGRFGTYIRSPRGKSPIESSLPDSDSAWTDLVANKDGVYACGTHGAFAEFKKNRWKILPKSPIKKDWASVAVSPNGPIYACGESGAVWSFNGKKWTDQSIKTPLSLSAIVASKNRIIVGSDGYVFVRDGKKPWEKLKLPMSETVESLIDSPIGTFVLTPSMLYKLEKGKFEKVLVAKDFKIDFADCDYVEKRLWLTGGGLVISWDGSQTETFLCPENERSGKKK